ncbi:midasin-like [Tubulanus polymorphus]|uniref:midasin-like n=1 Tax=Tubulanus polymorphus TaxID=672921 RepID=UPI003DA52D2F
MLHGLGLVGKLPCETLLMICREIESRGNSVDQISLLDILHVAQLTVQQLERGCHLLDALRTSCVSVLVKMQRNFTKRQEIKEVIETYLQKLDLEQFEATSNTSSLVCEGLWPVSLPSISNWTTDSTVSTVKHQMVPLMHIVSEILQNVGLQSGTREQALSYNELVRTKFSWPPNHQESDRLTSMLGVLCTMCLETVSINDLPLRKLILERLISSQIERCANRNKATTKLNQLLRNMMNSLKPESIDIFSGVLRQIENCSGMDLSQHPVDLRWNSQLLDHLTIKMDPDASHRISITTLGNKYYLLNILLEKQKLPESWQLEGQRRDKSPIQISYEFHAGLTDTAKEQESLIHIYPFFQAFDLELNGEIESMSSMSDETLYKLVDCLQWRWYFLCICQQKVKSSGGYKVLMPQLALHWNWFYNKCFNRMFSVTKISSTLETLVDCLNRLLGTDNEASMLQLKMWSGFGYPKPFQKTSFAEVTVKLLGLAQILDVFRVTVSGQMWPIVKYLTSVNGCYTRQRIDELFTMLLTNPSCNIDEICQKVLDIETELIQFGILYKPGAWNKDISQTEIQQAPALQQKLLPFYEYASLVIQKQWLNRGMDRSILNHIIDYILHFTMVSPELLIPLRQLAIVNSEDKEQLPTIIANLVGQQYSSSVTKDLLLWLLPHAIETEEPLDIESIEGPGALQTPHLAFMTMTVLTDTCRDVGIKQSYGNLQMTVPLGQCGEKLKLFQSLAKFVWSNASLVSDEIVDLRSCDENLIKIILKRLLSALSNLSPDISCHETEQAYNSIDDYVAVIEEIAKSEVLPTRMIDMLNTILQCMSKSVTLPDPMKRLYECGKLWSYVGLLQTLLLAPQGPVDPAEKQAIKLTYTNEQIGEIDMNLMTRNWANKIWTGKNLDPRDPSNHPRLLFMSDQLTALRNKAAILEQRIAIRPQPPKFIALLNDVKQYINAIGSESRVLTMITQLDTVLNCVSNDKTSTNLNTLLKEEKSWQSTVQSFIRKINRDYPFYTDLTAPFLAGISELSYGIRLMCHALQVITRQIEWKLNTEQVSVKSHVLALCKFPFIGTDIPSSLQLSEILTSHSTSMSMKQLLFSKESEDGSARITDFITRMRKQALLSLMNHIIVTGKLDDKTMIAFNNLLELFATSWLEMEERKKQKEIEDNSLYRYKEKSHGDELTEDEQDDLDLHRNFPSYESEMADLINQGKLDTSPPISGDTESEEDNSVFEVSAADMKFVSDMHYEIIVPYTQSSWLQKRTSNQNKDFRQPLMLGYQNACSVVKNRIIDIDPQTDDELLASHLIVLNTLEHSTQEQLENSSSQKPYDVYHDPNIAEVVQCRPLLYLLNSRVQELLLEWPDHPALKQIVDVINRILSFTITSPLMKLVAGIDVLLQKLQDWETNAARHVSLRSHIDSISQLLIQYRRYELKCWRSCLDMVSWRVREKASKWWFHLHQVLHGYIACTDEWIEDGVRKLVEALQNFMETSVLGEYETRLQYLYTFHCHLVSMQAVHTRQMENAQTILWNLYQFYSQFQTNVDAKIASLRSPIEKELKGYVKIARWNDINFWAMKQAAEKTHRTLQKHMKQYETVLHQPVRTLLIDQKESLSEKKIKIPVTDVNLYITSEMILSVLSTEEGSVLNRLPSLQSRMMKHCRSIFIQCNYKSMIESVDQFTGDIISTVHELQAADLTQVGDKEKQKAEAKHLNLRKRKALAELFKYLTTLGLSYRKGIIELEGRSNSDLMTCPVLDLQAALLSIIHQRCDDELLSTWEGCQKYFCRCIARRALLHTSLQTPSKELGPSEIDRCKGFTENLLTLCCSQQNVLQKAAEQFLNLRTQLSDLEEVRKTESKITRLPPQRSLQREKGRLETVIHQFDEGLNQFLVLLDAVPASSEAVNPYPSVYQSAAASLVRGDERHMNIQQCIKEILEEVQTVKQQLVKVKNSSLLTWSVYEVIKSGFEKLKSSSSKLQHIEEIFADRTCLSKTLTYLRKTLCQELSEFSKWNEELNVLQLPDNSKSSDQLMSDSQSVKEFTVNTENLATNILLVVQHLLKCHPVSEQTDADEDTVEDGHLSKLLHKQLMKDIELLNLLQITSTMEELVQGIISLSDTGELNHSNYCTGLLLNLIPLVKQYTLLVQYCITQCTATYRTSCKLLSVLLGIFSEIIQKGFCLPAEMSDELAGDGATKFEDMENAGMGEGQGQKDVSDQIETEDQLEELKKAGEEDEKADPDEKPDVPDEDNAIEMSDDFEGKLHNLDPSKEDENENSEDDDEDVENKIDKQMGDVDDENADKLDDQVWGSDDEEPEEQEQKEDKKEEVGPGSGQQEESQVVAKEDSDKSETENQPENQPADEEQQEEKINEQEPMDEEYDENQTDPYHGKDKEVPEPEALDLPEDLQLDDEENEQDEENKEQGENPMDIDNLDQPENQGEDIDAEMNEDENAQDKNEEKDGDELEEDNKEEGKEEEQDGKKSAEEDESLDIEEKPENDDESRETGVQPQIDEKVDEEDQGDEGKNGAEENNDEDNTVTEAYGKKDHDVQAAEQSESAQDSAGKTDETEENEGNGTAEADDMLGHEGSTSQQAARGQENKQRNKPQKRKPGQSDADRTMGSTDEKIKRLQTIDTKLDDQSDQVSDDKQESDLYEHINKAVSQYDAQTLDAATAEQLDQQPIPAMEDEDAEEVGPDDENMQPQDDEKCTDETVEKKLSAMKLKEKKSAENEHGEESVADEGNQASTIEGENMITMSVAPGNTSFHTALDKMTPLMGHDVEKLRNELESSFTMWQRPSGYSPEQAREAEELWYKYDAVTSSLSQELCEQLRLVLEPSRCTKLKGDYRTGKRLNMRKVIPYIASQFRKDKIWLRRTKPSKRQYQILLAVDDSSSMADNHSKQLAFESLATIANALTLLEAGELAICSFGESTQLLHPFHEQFSNQSGASLLQQFTFEQHKTKIAEFMKDVTGIMLNAREHQQGPATQEISQLVLIVSDGRGLFLEGMDVVLRAVQQAREANLFLVFVILDNPNNKNSIMDIKVPIFKGAGQMPEIRSYMEQFPFPFYIILRDINALPHTLADALRQWFELISAADR